MAMTLDDIKKLSPRLKALIICLVYIVLGYFYYFYFLHADLEKRGNLQTKIEELEQQVATKEHLAAEMGKYAKRMDTLRAEFKIALTKLPVRKEIPELLSSVALSGRDTGITFLLFEPQAPVKKQIGGKEEDASQKAAEQKPVDNKAAGGESKSAKPPEEGDYYEEIPVKVTVNAGYHNAAVFFEKVARLPRIVNIEDISMENAKPARGKGTLLTTSCIIKTYMFVQKTGEKGKGTDEKNP